jgi:hypothetical protein
MDSSVTFNAAFSAFSPLATKMMESHNNVAKKEGKTRVKENILVAKNGGRGISKKQWANLWENVIKKRMIKSKNWRIDLGAFVCGL